MTDDQMRSLLEEGFEAMDTTPEDVERSTHQVMEQKAHVRQRSRWWPYPVFHRRTQSPTTKHTTEHQPGQIPATNGHTPTVIGRTSSMFSPVKAITVGALVFAIGGSFLIAQPFAQQGDSVPGATMDVEPAWVTGTVRFGSACSSNPAVEENGVLHESFDCQGQIWTADDPRLTGDVRVMWNGDAYPVGGDGSEFISVLSNKYVLTTDHGTWDCESVDLGKGKGLQPVLGEDIMTCHGGDAYEGLTAIVQAEFSGPPYSFEAIVFSGQVPLTPDPSEFE